MPVKDQLLQYYQAHTKRVDVGLFLAGFGFDIFTLADFDDWLSLSQQFVYLFVVGAILMADFLYTRAKQVANDQHSKTSGGPLSQLRLRLWEWRHAILHFLLGSLLSVYALYYLKSASLSASAIFIGVIVLLLIANETSFFRARADMKIVLFVICLFSFFSTLVPVLLGFVGVTPFVISLALCAGLLFQMGRYLFKCNVAFDRIRRAWLIPSGGVLSLCLIFYLWGVIPPIPLAVKDMGVYHQIEKRDGQYILYFEKPWWKFWSHDDSDFVALPGDKIFLFLKVYSPARFDDSVVLKWEYDDPRQGWLPSDQIPMKISGGRRDGYRGFAVKQNYTPGDWRVSVETTDGREIGRHTFTITRGEGAATERQFVTRVN